MGSVGRGEGYTFGRRINELDFKAIRAEEMRERGERVRTSLTPMAARLPTPPWPVTPSLISTTRSISLYATGKSPSV